MTMSTRDDGGPLFPVVHHFEGHDGISLRDWFAGQAIAGVLANPDRVSPLREVVDFAFDVADAMLAARTASLTGRSE